MGGGYSRVGFATRFGGLLAAAGSAVGLGNIWRFPTQAGENGGSAFIMVYLLCILIFGIPLLVAEFAIGRHARANVGNAYRILAPGTRWKFVGVLSVAVAFFIFCYYNVVVGWVLYYTYDAVMGDFIALGQTADPAAAFTGHFTSFIADPFLPLLFLVLELALVYAVIVSGVQKGIERSAKLLMPVLFFIMILLAVLAVFMPGAAAGYEFLFAFKPGELTPAICLSALGQCFYSLSLGMGLITYASYFRRDVNLGGTAVTVALMDSVVAILAGLVIFPAVFSVPGMEPASGAGLVFIALPNVFNSALSGIPALAWLTQVLFYLTLLVAALTSTIFLHEVSTAYVAEKTGMSRHKAATAVTAAALIIGAACSLSLGPWTFTFFGMTLFDFLDYVTAKLILPLTGAGAALFVGWKLTRRQLWVELTSHGTVRFRWVRPLLFLLRFVIPILIALIMISQFGLF